MSVWRVLTSLLFGTTFSLDKIVSFLIHFSLVRIWGTCTPNLNPSFKDVRSPGEQLQSSRLASLSKYGATMAESISMRILRGWEGSTVAGLEEVTLERIFRKVRILYEQREEALGGICSDLSIETIELFAFQLTLYESVFITAII